MKFFRKLIILLIINNKLIEIDVKIQIFLEKIMNNNNLIKFKSNQFYKYLKSKLENNNTLILKKIIIYSTTNNKCLKKKDKKKIKKIFYHKIY